jgi:hypothetical protein
LPVKNLQLKSNRRHGQSLKQGMERSRVALERIQLAPMASVVTAPSGGTDTPSCRVRTMEVIVPVSVDDMAIWFPETQ